MKSLISCSGLSSCVRSGIPESTRLSLMLRDCKSSIVSFMSLFSFATEVSWVVSDLTECWRDSFIFVS